MDSVAQDSPFLRVIIAADFVDRLLDAKFSLSCLTFAYYIFFGGRLDIILVLALLAILNRGAVSILASGWGITCAALVASFGALARWASFHGLQPHLREKHLAKIGPSGSGRFANDTERKLENSFRHYLRYLVEQSPSRITIEYTSSGLLDANEVFVSRAAITGTGVSEHAEIRILTSAFYTRFVHYAHDFEGIFCELAEHQTIWVDKPEVLPKIFLKKQSPPLHAPSVMDFLYMKLIQNLRRRPRGIRSSKKPNATASLATHSSDIRSFRISPMDAFILGKADTKTKRAYRSAVARLFLADWLTMGNLPVLRFAELSWRIIVATPVAIFVNQMVQAAVSAHT
jgi:hypothetical protein